MDSIMHAEVPYEDRARAQKFYEGVFGWQITKMPDIDYLWANTAESDPDTMMPKNPGAINCGLMQKQHPGHGPTIVIGVESIDSHLKKIADAGGRVTLPKMAVGTHGFYAMVADTEGNIIALWENAKHG